MTENGLPPGTPSGAFDAAEQNFFREGEAIESGEFSLDELTDRRPRSPRAWWPRLIPVGAAAGVALLVLLLAGGRKPAGEAVAAVTVAPGPSLPEAKSAQPAPAAQAVAPAPEARAVVKAKKIKRAHNRHHAARKRR